MINYKIDRRKLSIGYWVARVLLVGLVIVTFIPFILMIFMSVKSSIDIAVDFWALPRKLEIANYTKGFSYLVRPVINTLTVAAITLVVELFLVGLSAYTFARYKFKGKEVLFTMFIAIMMIPYPILLVPTFSIIVKMHLLNSYLALIIPYVAGQQIFGIVIARSYFAGLPEELFESARIEGAGELRTFFSIALPLAVPIMITVGITSLISIYNDYIWPVLVLSGQSKKVFTQALVAMTAGQSSNAGLQAAGYVIGSIPLILITASCLKYYLQGMLQGAIKS